MRSCFHFNQSSSVKIYVNDPKRCFVKQRAVLLIYAFKYTKQSNRTNSPFFKTIQFFFTIVPLWCHIRIWIPGYLDSSLSDWNFLLSERRLPCYDLRRSALYILPPGTVRLVAIVVVSFATVSTQSSVKPFGYFWCITRQLLSITKIILWNGINISACCYNNAKYLSSNLRCLNQTSIFILQYLTTKLWQMQFLCRVMVPQLTCNSTAWYLFRTKQNTKALQNRHFVSGIKDHQLIRPTNGQQCGNRVHATALSWCL